jgi:subtilisin family serine protease
VLDDKGRGTSEMIVQALQWAARERADVVSMSLGFDFGTMVDKLVNQQGMPIQAATSIALRAYRDNLRVFDAVMDLLAAQAQLGVNTVVVAAAGNESRRNCSPSYTVAASLPAAARGMLCVGAVGQASGNYGIGYFSNTFPTLVAPGVSILSAAVGGGLKAMDGTSMACPHAAGVAVLWSEALRLGGRKAPTELIIANMITSARKDVFTTAYDESEFGQGLVQAPA